MCLKYAHMVDKHFNRLKGEIDNIYLPFYGAKSCFDEKYVGYVKCKLIHSPDDSLIFVDQIFLSYNETEFCWFQPLTIFANLLCEDKENDIVLCGIHVDISSGNTLRIDFTNRDWICNFEDNSSLFKCTINGPKDLYQYSTGTGYFIENTPYLKLFHHTLPEYKSLIVESKILKPSKWNIQGTKTLVNIHYAYFTCLANIEKDSDLTQIAMASNGTLTLIPDNIQIPSVLTPNELEKYEDKILNIKVYRESTYNRSATLEFFINATILAPKHLWKHLPKDNFAFYEICMPFIYRIGMQPFCPVKLDSPIINKQKDMKMFNYQVVGLATDLAGLKAPFDEEDTEYLFKIEPLNSNTNILTFWFEHSNSDLYTSKIIDVQEFDNQ